MRPVGVQLLVMFVALSGLSGCGEKGPPIGAVEGTVTYRQKPVAEGFVVFENRAMGWTRSAELAQDGSYRCVKVPVAEYLVRVVPPDPELPNEITGFRGDVTPLMPNPENIPKRFRTAESTPLRANVVEGKNRYDFELSTDSGAPTAPR